MNNMNNMNMSMSMNSNKDYDMHAAIQFTLNSLWKHYLEITFSIASVIALVTLANRFRKSRKSRKTYGTAVTTYQTYKTTGKLLELQSQMPYETNAVYLTRFKVDGPLLYLLHMFYGAYSYFYDLINLFCLCICIGQFATYREYRHAAQLFVFTTLYLSSYFYSQIGAIREQQHINKKRATVTRVGVTTQVPLTAVRRGDFISLASGDYVPADILLLNSKAMVSELDLTGENTIVIKEGLPVGLTAGLSDMEVTINHHSNSGTLGSARDTIHYTRDNILFRGTKVLPSLDGPYGIVIETGNDCEIYRIDYGNSRTLTVLQKTITETCTKNFILMISLSVLVGFIIYEKSDVLNTNVLNTDVFNTNVNILRNVNNVILFINTLIPLSLQFFYTVACGLLSRKLGQRHRVSFNPGGTQAFQHAPSHIVTDKTGTLTTGRVQLHEVVSLQADNELPIMVLNNPGAEQLAGMLAVIDPQGGDPLEDELRKWCQQHDTGGKGHDIKKKVVIPIYRLSFQRRLGCKLVVTESDDGYTVHLQGIPETLCKYYGRNTGEYLGQLANGDEDPSDRYRRLLAYVCAPISRVDFLTLQRGDIEAWARYLSKDASFTDILVYVYYDFLVPGLQEAILDVTSQGTGVTILTGDSLTSAQVVVSRVFGESRLVHYTSGKEFEDLSRSGDDIPELVPLEDHLIGSCSVTCIYRASPHIKQLYVAHLQEAGNTVLMIGDGPNDVSAIKQSDYGVAVKGESETAQSVADVVLEGWTQLPPLLADCQRETETIRNIVEWVLLKHMLTGCTLIGLLLTSFFAQVRDPASPHVMALYNGAAFLLMIIYIYGPAAGPGGPGGPTGPGTDRKESGMSIGVGALTGLCMGAWIFTLPGELSSKIYIAISAQFYLLTFKLYLFSRRLAFMLIGLMLVSGAAWWQDDLYGYISTMLVSSSIFYLLTRPDL